MSPDEQQALSYKYSSDVWSFIYLDQSGNWALFNHAKELVGVYKGYREMMEVYRARPKVTEPKPITVVDDGLSAEELLKELGL